MNPELFELDDFEFEEEMVLLESALRWGKAGVDCATQPYPPSKVSSDSGELDTLKTWFPYCGGAALGCWGDANVIGFGV